MPGNLNELLAKLQSTGEAKTPVPAAAPAVAPETPALAVSVPAPVPSEVQAAAPPVQPETALPTITKEAEFARFDKLADEALQNVREDRNQAQSVIALCQYKCQAAGQDRVDRIWVEMYVSAIEVKSKANEQFVKIMDSRAKLHSGLKAIAINNTQNNQFNDDAALINLLNEPVEDEDNA